MKKAWAWVLTAALLIGLFAATVALPVAAETTLDAYDTNQMSVPYFGPGADWIWEEEGAGPDLLTFVKGDELAFDGIYSVMGIRPGSVMALENVDFGENGPAKAYLLGASGDTSGFKMEVRLDAEDGVLLGTFERTTAVDWQWSVNPTDPMAEFDAAADVTGVHTLYLVTTAGAMNFYGIYFDEKAGGQPDPGPEPDPDPTPDPGPSSDVILDAYNIDEMRVPYFGIGAKWIWDPAGETDGLGPHLLSYESSALQDDTYVVTGLMTGAVMKLYHVDFGSTTPSKAYLRAGSGDETGFAMEVRLDAADGPLLGTFQSSTPTDGGWSVSDAVVAQFDVTADVTGVHTLYFVMTAGAMNFHGVYFEGEPEPVKPVENRVDAFVEGGITVPGYGPAGSEQLINVVNGGNLGEYIVDTTGAGTVIEVLGVNFSQQPGFAYFHGNTGNETGFCIELHLDSKDGPLIGTFERPDATAGGWSTGVESIAAQFEITESVTGAHNLYLVFASGSANFYGITFSGVGNDLTALPPAKPAEKKVTAYADGGLLVQYFGVAVENSGDIISVVRKPGLDEEYLISGTGTDTIIEFLGLDFDVYGPIRAHLMGNTGMEEGLDVELRLDSADGELIGTFHRDGPTDGGWSSGVENVMASIDITQNITGVHNMYLVFKRGAGNIYGLMFDPPEDPNDTTTTESIIPYEMLVQDANTPGGDGGSKPVWPWIVGICAGVVAVGAAVTLLIVFQKKKGKPAQGK